MQKLIDALKPYADYITMRIREPMRFHTTFCVGGPADLFLEWNGEGPVGEILKTIRAHEVPLTLLGRGSNVLVRDEGIRGVVFCTLGAKKIEVTEDGIRAQAGATLAAAASAALRHSLTGMEFAAGIPGTLGGAVFMNAGAYGGQMADLVTASRYLDQDGEIHTITGGEHGFGYRESVYKAHPEQLILDADLALQPGNPEEIRAKMDDLAARRREKQPLEYGSAGSTFKRPAGHFAGQLIEESGLKGVSVGAAQVSEKHAGFIINRGGATCEDVLRLIDLVQRRVKENFGVDLECEVRLL